MNQQKTTRRKRQFLNVELTGNTCEMIDALCAREGRSRSSMTRKLIRDAYKLLPDRSEPTGQ